MDAHLSLIMANQARVQENHLVMDPFVGTGRCLGSTDWFLLFSTLSYSDKQKFCLLCPPHWGVDILFLLFLASSVWCLPSVTLGFRSFQGKVFILSLPNLVWVFIGLIACVGLLLVKIAL